MNKISSKSKNAGQFSLKWNHFVCHNWNNHKVLLWLSRDIMLISSCMVGLYRTYIYSIKVAMCVYMIIYALYEMKLITNQDGVWWNVSVSFYLIALLIHQMSEPVHLPDHCQMKETLPTWSWNASYCNTVAIMFSYFSYGAGRKHRAWQWLKTGSCHHANFVITSGTVGFHHDSLLGCQWWQCWLFALLSYAVFDLSVMLFLTSQLCCFCRILILIYMAPVPVCCYHLPFISCVSENWYSWNRLEMLTIDTATVSWSLPVCCLV